MANQITVNSGTGNITVTTSRSVIGTVANVASANYANFAGEANTANSATVAASANSVALANVTGAGNIASINLDGNVSNVLRGDGTFSGLPDTANANFANFAGTVTNSAQPNITSVGTLGNLTVANTILTEDLTVTGNFSVGNLVANNANYANFAGVAYSVDGANVSGEVAVANVVSNPTQSNITAVGTLGNLDVSGTITANLIQANTIEGNIALTQVDYIDFDTANGSPGFQTGRVYWDSAKGSLAVDMNGGGNITQQIGEDQYIYVKANATITSGQVVMFNGVQGDTILGAPANTASAGFLPRYTIGIAPANIANGNFGYVQTFGEVYDQLTNAFPVGSILYLQANSAGALTATEPTAPDPKIVVAACLTQSSTPSSTNGRLQVRPDFGYYMEQLHNVSNATANTGDVLVYNSSNVYVPGNTVPAWNVTDSLFVEGVNSNVTLGNGTFAGQNWLAIHTGEYDSNTGTTLQQALVTDNYANVGNVKITSYANTAAGNVAIGASIQFESYDAIGNSNTDPLVATRLVFTANPANADLANASTQTNTLLRIGGSDGDGVLTIVGSNAGDDYLSGAWKQFQYRPKAMDFIRRNGNADVRVSSAANDETSFNFYNTQSLSGGSSPGITWNYPAKMGSKVDPGWVDPQNGSSGVPQGFFFTVVGTDFGNIEHRMYANGTTTFNAFAQDVNGNTVSTNPITLGADGIITADGSGLSNIALANITGIGNIANINLDGNASNILFGNGVFAAAPNVSANFANFAGEVTNSAQPNITSVGTLTSLTANGNIISQSANVVIADVPDTFTFDFYPSYTKKNEYRPDYGNNNYKSAELNLTKDYENSGGFAILKENAYYVEDTGNTAVAIAGAQLYETTDVLGSGNAAVSATRYDWIPSPDSNLSGFALGTWSKHGLHAEGLSGLVTLIGANIGNTAAHTIYNYNPVGIQFLRRNGNGQSGGTRLPVNASDYVANIQWQPYGRNGSGAVAIVSSPATFGAKVDSAYTGANAEVVPVGYELTTVSSNGALKTHNFYANGDVTLNLSGTLTANGAGLSSLAGANVTGEVAFAATANAVAVGNVSGIGNIATINLNGNSSTVLLGDGTFASPPAGSSISNGNSSVYFTGPSGDLSINIDGNVFSQFGPQGLKLLGANTGPSDVSKLEITNGGLNWILDNTNFSGGTPFGMNQWNNNDALAYGLNFYRARGSFASQADVQAGDQGYSRTTQFRYSGGIVNGGTELVTANTFSGSNVAITHSFSADSDTANSKFSVNFGQSEFLGNLTANNVTATQYVVLSNDTAANVANLTGVAGAMIAVNDQDYQPAYWSVTDTVWKYVSNRANV